MSWDSKWVFYLWIGYCLHDYKKIVDAEKSISNFYPFYAIQRHHCHEHLMRYRVSGSHELAVLLDLCSLHDTETQKSKILLSIMQIQMITLSDGIPYSLKTTKNVFAKTINRHQWNDIYYIDYQIYVRCHLHKFFFHLCIDV